MSIGNIFSSKKEEETKEEQPKPSYGMAKKSAASAKPATRKAGTVRKGSIYKEKAPVELTKEEKKAAKKEANAEFDRMNAVANVLLEGNETYNALRRKWWWSIIVGLALAGISWVTLRKDQASPDQTQHLISIVTLALSYVFIIGAMIFDVRKIKPLRNAAADKAKSYSRRKQEEILREAEARKNKKKESKKKNK